MSVFGAYLLGALLVLAGVAVGAFFLNVPLAWIIGGVVATFGLGAGVVTRRIRPPDNA